MALQSILATQTVSASDLRDNPCQYFINQPVAVLSRSKTAGYMVSRELFESMVSLLEKAYPETHPAGHLTKERLHEIAQNCQQNLHQADDAMLGQFHE